MTSADLGKTQLRQRELYQDRWSSLGAQTGLLGLSSQPTPDELRQLDVFRDLDDRLLEKIGPDVSIALWRKGSVLFEEGTYIDLAFWVAEGEVEVSLEGVAPDASATRPIFDPSRTVVDMALGGLTEKDLAHTTLAGPSRVTRPGEITFLATMDFDLPRGSAARLGPGEFFGEIGALSGWPQSVTARTATDCRLLQIRMPALRMLRRRAPSIKEELDRRYRERSLAAQLKNTPLFFGCTDVFVQALKASVELVSCSPGEVIAEEGAEADALYLVRSGFVKLLQGFGEGELVVSYLSKGMTLGDAEMLIDELDRWQVSAVSVESSELVRIPKEILAEVLRSQPQIAEQLWRSATDRIKDAGFSRRHIGHSEFTQVALDQGLVQGNSILVMDLNSCTRCDDCVRACADTHGGRPRFLREGSRYENLLIAKSCYHCRDPVCLIGCPTGAIHRAGAGAEVVIDEEICIGCATCFRNCPYDAIVMHDTESVWPDDAIPSGLRGKERKLASKCDLCADTGHGPACVSNCPQACAYRVGTLEDFEGLLERGD